MAVSVCVCVCVCVCVRAHAIRVWKHACVLRSAPRHSGSVHAHTVCAGLRTPDGRLGALAGHSFDRPMSRSYSRIPAARARRLANHLRPSAHSPAGQPGDHHHKRGILSLAGQDPTRVLGA